MCVECVVSTDKFAYVNVPVPSVAYLTEIGMWDYVEESSENKHKYIHISLRHATQKTKVLRTNY